MSKLIATSVVRGSNQGESHGGVYLIDFDREAVNQVIDWNTTDIDWQGRGWDRGLRGIAFDGDRVFIAASNEIFVYTPQFKKIASYKCPYLMHAHEIMVHKRRLYITSTGFDAILGFDLDNNEFCFGLHLVDIEGQVQGRPFDPKSEKGPAPSNTLHVNNVFCSSKGLFFSGLRTKALYMFNGKTIQRYARLPTGIHNARPFREGVLYNDTATDRVRYIEQEQQFSFEVPQFDPGQLTHAKLDDSRIARAGFGRGLCELGGGLVAAGSSPSTIALHDFDRLKTVKTVNLTMDIRNAIHGLEVWPY
ncbi:hypothetical protein [Oceanicoccus sagamiensis]|uniref:Uncharacterized protein n=1 Tax=Oceanicoccus sagamiensis TaxID=716816 RepID=A0A1X9NJE1_9GAMM|nr:hypothetical protein [Oceanicoccus sagamiensis]ARN75965.1 hypothetical protein BST96_18815 [Oceanicoccus sagamiensis]